MAAHSLETIGKRVESPYDAKLERRVSNWLFALAMVLVSISEVLDVPVPAFGGLCVLSSACAVRGAIFGLGQGNREATFLYASMLPGLLVPVCAFALSAIEIEMKSLSCTVVPVSFVLPVLFVAYSPLAFAAGCCATVWVWNRHYARQRVDYVGCDAANRSEEFKCIEKGKDGQEQ